MEKAAVRLMTVLAVALLSLLACTPGDTDRSRGTKGEQVSRADFGDGWPLVVDQGQLRCEAPSRLVFTDPNGSEWGVNGMAITHGYPEIDPIWADNPEIPGTKKNIGPLIDRGLSMCEE